MILWPTCVSWTKIHIFQPKRGKFCGKTWGVKEARFQRFPRSQVPFSDAIRTTAALTYSRSSFKPILCNYIIDDYKSRLAKCSTQIGMCGAHLYDIPFRLSPVDPIQKILHLQRELAPCHHCTVGTNRDQQIPRGETGTLSSHPFLGVGTSGLPVWAAVARQEPEGFPGHGKAVQCPRSEALELPLLWAGSECLRKLLGPPGPAVSSAALFKGTCAAGSHSTRQFTNTRFLEYLTVSNQGKLGGGGESTTLLGWSRVSSQHS